MGEPTIWELILRELSEIKEMLGGLEERTAENEKHINRLYGGLGLASFIIVVGMSLYKLFH